MNQILNYLDLAAVFVLFIVVIFLELSFMAKIGIVIAMGLFLAWTAWKRHMVAQELDKELNVGKPTITKL